MTQVGRTTAALVAVAAMLATLLAVAPATAAPAVASETSAVMAGTSAASLAAACPTGEVPAPGFEDLRGGVHDDAIACLAWWGLTIGADEATYRPDGTLTRQQAIRLVTRLLDVTDRAGAGAGAPAPSFPDLGDDAALTDAAGRLAALGVLQGFDDGTVRPGERLTRGQLASFVGRAAHDVLERDWLRTSGRFADVVGSVHQPAIERLASVDIVQGRRGGTEFGASAPIRRDQVASVLVRLLDVLVAEGLAVPPVGVDCEVDGLTPAQHDRCVQLNQLQVLGTHNSYKLPLPDGVRGLLETVMPDLVRELDYAHDPLPEQLAEQGIRQIELDVFADPDGGRYAEPLGLCLFEELPDGGLPELQEPGVKVLHAQDVDFETTCPTLIGCLEQVRGWSDDHPRHLPIAVLIEAKTSLIEDELPDGLDLPLDFVEPLPFTTERLDDLDAEIRSVFADDRLITPDDVRGDAERLEDAVLDDRWPTLSQARGKVMFLLDNRGVERTRYREGRPNLEGRAMFTSSSPGEDDAAFVQLHEPRGDGDTIADAVRDGYLVRTRSDIPGQEAYSGDTSRRDAALGSGAQFVSTDYPFQSPYSDYIVTIPDGTPARCNPVNAPTWCDTDLLGP